MKSITFKMPDEDVAKLDELVRVLRYRTRSHALRTSIDHLLSLHKGDWYAWEKPGDKKKKAPKLASKKQAG